MCNWPTDLPLSILHTTWLYAQKHSVSKYSACRDVSGVQDSALHTRHSTTHHRNLVLFDWIFGYLMFLCTKLRTRQTVVHQLIVMLLVISISYLYGCHYLLLTYYLFVTLCMSIGCGGFVYLCITNMWGANCGWNMGETSRVSIIYYFIRAVCIWWCVWVITV
jgi:hypothetical protein